MLTQFQQAQLMQQQQLQQSAAQEVGNFLSQAEFGEDVREDMADILESAQRKGQNLTLADAYRKACMMNDNVRSVLIQRQKASGAQQQTQAAQRAKASAVQVSGSAPMGGMKQDPTDIRSAIEAAIAANVR
jgi:predicted Zn-ribbon and HTH transcriptional regulator